LDRNFLDFLWMGGWGHVRVNFKHTLNRYADYSGIIR